MNPAQPKVARARPYQYGHLAGQAGHCLLTGADTAGAHSLSVSVIQPGSHAPLHVHSREDETFFVLSGELDARIGETHETLSAGDCVFLPRGIPHRLANLGTAPAEVIMLIHPPGLETFFAEMTQLTNAGSATPARMKETAGRYGVTILESPNQPPSTDP